MKIAVSKMIAIPIQYSYTKGTKRNIIYKLNIHIYIYIHTHNYEGWNFNSGNYLFTTDTK